DRDVCRRDRWCAVYRLYCPGRPCNLGYELRVLRVHIRILRADVLPEEFRCDHRDTALDRRRDRGRTSLGCHPERDLGYDHAAGACGVRGHLASLLAFSHPARVPRRAHVCRPCDVLYRNHAEHRHAQLPVVPAHHADDALLGHLLSTHHSPGDPPVRRPRDLPAHPPCGAHADGHHSLSRSAAPPEYRLDCRRHDHLLHHLDQPDAAP